MGSVLDGIEQRHSDALSKLQASTTEFQASRFNAIAYVITWVTGQRGKLIG